MTVGDIPHKASPTMAAKESSTADRAMWSAVDAAAAPVSSLVVTAVLVRTLGAEGYGILVIALAVSGLSMAVAPAIAATTTRFVSHARGRKDVRASEAAGVITASLMAVVIVDLVFFGAVLVFRDFLANLVFGSAAVARVDRGNLLLLAVLAMGIQQIDTVLAAAIRGLERFRRQALLEVGSRVVQAACVVAAAWMWSDVEIVLFFQCVTCAGATLLRIAALRAVLPERRVLAMPARSELDAVFRYGGWMWLSAIGGVAFSNADRIIIGHVLGPASAGRFNVCVQIAQLVHYVPSSLFAFSLPAFSRLGAQGGGAREIVQAYRRYRAVIIATAVGVAVPILLWSGHLMALLAGDKVDPGQEQVLALLIVGFLVLACCIAAYFLLLGLGEPRPVSLTMTVSMLVALALMLTLIRQYGLIGAALARVAYSIGTLTLLYQAHEALRRV
jgi:O-antigen/teichoic acid export membrane protein